MLSACGQCLPLLIAQLAPKPDDTWTHSLKHREPKMIQSLWAATKPRQPWPAKASTPSVVPADGGTKVCPALHRVLCSRECNFFQVLAKPHSGKYSLLKGLQSGPGSQHQSGSFVLFYFFNIYLGEKKSARRTGKVLSRLPAECVAQHGAWSYDPEIMIWAETKSRVLKRLSHPGVPQSGSFYHKLLRGVPLWWTRKEWYVCEKILDAGTGHSSMPFASHPPEVLRFLSKIKHNKKFTNFKDIKFNHIQLWSKS